MTKYFYKAVKDQKELVTGHIEAEDFEKAKIKIKELGFMPAGIYTESNIPNEYKKLYKPALNRIRLGELRHFTTELQTLTDSGISILDALDSIMENAPSANVGKLSEDLSKKIKSGQTFSESLEPYRQTLGEIYLALCKTGEDSGNLPMTLKYLAELLKKQEDLRGKLIQTSIYPAILVLAMFVMFLLFGGLLFPKMITLMSVAANEIPLTVKFFTVGYDLFVKFAPLAILVCAGAWYAIGNSIGFDKIKIKFFDLLMNIPVIKDCLLYLNISHYMTVMHIAYDSGIPIMDTLKLAEGTLYINILQQKASKVYLNVQNGKTLANAYQIERILPNTMISLISTGEKTGQLGKMFSDIAKTISEKLDSAIESLSKLFEPTMLTVIGIGVAIIAIAIIQMYAKSFESFF